MPTDDVALPCEALLGWHRITAEEMCDPTYDTERRWRAPNDGIERLLPSRDANFAARVQEALRERGVYLETEVNDDDPPYRVSAYRPREWSGTAPTAYDRIAREGAPTWHDAVLAAAVAVVREENA